MRMVLHECTRLGMTGAGGARERAGESVRESERGGHSRADDRRHDLAPPYRWQVVLLCFHLLVSLHSV